MSRRPSATWPAARSLRVPGKVMAVLVPRKCAAHAARPRLRAYAVRLRVEADEHLPRAEDASVRAVRRRDLERIGDTASSPRANSARRAPPSVRPAGTVQARTPRRGTVAASAVLCARCDDRRVRLVPTGRIQEKRRRVVWAGQPPGEIEPQLVAGEIAAVDRKPDDISDEQGAQRAPIAATSVSVGKRRGRKTLGSEDCRGAARSQCARF